MENQADIPHSRGVLSLHAGIAVLGDSTKDEYHSQPEDLDSFNLTAPPLLDWRFDSSDEMCSIGDIEEPKSMGASLEDYGARQASLTPTKVEKITDLKTEQLPNQKAGDLMNQKANDSTNDRQRTSESDDSESLEETRRAPTENQQHDQDHSQIQELLNQLQLFHSTPSAELTPEPETEKSTLNADHAAENLSSSCLVFDAVHQSYLEGSTASGLLFTTSNQRELLKLLEEPPNPQECYESQDSHSTYAEQTTESPVGERLQLPDCQKRYITRSGEADEMVSISYGSEVWHSPFQDDQQWQQSECESLEELRSHRADVDAEGEPQTSYKDVPGPCDPEDLLDGIVFGAKYLGSTQLQTDRSPSTNARMAQAQEAVDRIKAPEGEYQPMTEVDLFISTQRIKVLNADTQEAMMDHSLQMISYIADIGSLVVLMVRRKPMEHKSADSAAFYSSPPKKYWMICHVFSSEDAQIIAQAIGQAFGVAYQQFLGANGMKASEFPSGEYGLSSQELYNGDLVHFSQSENIREVCIIKKVGEILGIAVVESGWGSILPTVVVANLLHGGVAERSGELSIGDRVMSVNGASLVGLPITTCHNIIRDLKNQSQVKLSIVHCPPVTMAIIKRPDPKYQLGFSVEDGIICSLMRGGIAERGGIRVGHRIIEINAQSVVATPHEKIINILTNAVGEIHLKTMPISTYRLLTGQEQPLFL